MKRPSWQWGAGVGALVLITSVGLLAAGWDVRRAMKPAQSKPVVARPAKPESGARKNELRMDLLGRGAHSAPAKDVFFPHSWQPARAVVVTKVEPAPEPPPPPPPPPPTAPALPFTFVGKFQVEGEKTTVYLAQGDRLHDVMAGDVIDGVYRVEAIVDARIDFVYLPLEQRQSLAMGSEP